jgi:hypothetical protein
LSGASCAIREDVDARSAQDFDSELGHKPGVVIELDRPGLHQRIRDQDTQPAGDVVVTGARLSERRVARPDHQWRTAVRLAPWCELHHALQHPCDPSGVASRW